MSDHDLADAIYREMTGPAQIDHALHLWRHAAREDWTVRDLVGYILAENCAVAISNVLVRRQREAARAGPWE